MASETLSDKIMTSIRDDSCLYVEDVREFIKDVFEELNKEKYSYTFECYVKKAIKKLAGEELTKEAEE